MWLLKSILLSVILTVALNVFLVRWRNRNRKP